MYGFFGLCFENLCREALKNIYSREGVTTSYEIGEYWDKNCQIDVVGCRDDGWTDLGECKWGNVKSLKTIHSELEHKVIQFPNRRNATIGRRIFTRKPLSKKEHSDIYVYSLDDLYQIC